MTVSITDVRNTIMISDKEFLTDNRINLAITDAGNSVNSNYSGNDTAVRYYTCYLLAQRFKMQYVTRAGDTSYSDVDPQVYLDMYNKYIRIQQGSTTQKINADDEMVDGSETY